MDKKAIMMIMALLAVLLCLVSLGVSLWYYFTPSEDESIEEESTEENNDSLLPNRPAFTLNVVNGDNETTQTVTPSGDETVDMTIEGDTATTTGATTTDDTTATETTPAEPAVDPTVLTCEEGQVESNGTCVPITVITPVETEPAVDPTVLTCEEGQVESNGTCVPVTPVVLCNKTKCNDWMNDMVNTKYWAFSTTHTNGSPHSHCGGCPHRAFKARYNVQLDSSTNSWTSKSSRSTAFDALKLQ